MQTNKLEKKKTPQIERVIEDTNEDITSGVHETKTMMSSKRNMLDIEQDEENAEKNEEKKL